MIEEKRELPHKITYSNFVAIFLFVQYSGLRGGGKGEKNKKPKKKKKKKKFAHLDLPRGASHRSVQGEVHGKLKPFVHWAVARAAVYAEELQKWRRFRVSTSAPASMVLLLLWVKTPEAVCVGMLAYSMYRQLMAVLGLRLLLKKEKGINAFVVKTQDRNIIISFFFLFCN